MKISNKDIEYLTEVLNNNKLTKVEYSEGDCKIKLSKEVSHISYESETSSLVKGEAETSNTTALNTLDENIQEIKCPLIGHFYLTKTPLDPPYVKVGDKISEGDVIGILQAMKVSNEIKATVSGEIVEILVESGQFVDYDCALIKVRES